MAWRIDNHITHGEIENRTSGRVTGRIWLTDRDEPVVIDLEGNALRDLAGSTLRFANPNARVSEQGRLSGFVSLQQGIAGDLTASRKVREPDCSEDELFEHLKNKTPFPFRVANCLYLEWYSTANGRVVIESTDFSLELDSDGTWTMTAEEEASLRVRNADAAQAFMEELERRLGVRDGDFLVDDGIGKESPGFDDERED